MKKKWIPYLIIVVLGIVLLVVKQFGSEKSKTLPKSTTEGGSQKKSDPASGPNRDHGFDRRVPYIEYTQHAKCRMECRKISQAEVSAIMKEGTINYRKTDVNAKPCPAYALEGTTEDNQRVRIVFGQCNERTKVITCIDLDTDWECHCPGDDDKYKNKN